MIQQQLLEQQILEPQVCKVYCLDFKVMCLMCKVQGFRVYVLGLG